MEVCELIEILKTMPQNTHVYHLWDGEARTKIELVWLANDGSVMTSDYNEPCYSWGTRPIGAPTEEQDRYWHTQKNPEEND